jgi:hypothetical protein
VLRPLSLVFYVKGAQFLLHAFPYLRVGFWIDLARGEARAGLALLVGALGAFCPVRRVGRVLRLAFVALVVGGRIGAECVAWIAVGIFIFLGPAMVS